MVERSMVMVEIIVYIIRNIHSIPYSNNEYINEDQNASLNNNFLFNHGEIPEIWENRKVYPSIIDYAIFFHTMSTNLTKQSTIHTKNTILTKLTIKNKKK